MNDNEVITFEDRSYINPEVSMSEQDDFIEKFKNIQAQNQAQINQDTYNLGSSSPSNLGGLTGTEGLMNTRYTRPAVNAAIENLRQINAQQAINTVMQSQQNAIANRLNQAKRAYYRAQQRSAASGGSGGSGGNNGDSTKGNINVEELTEGLGMNTISGNAPGTATVLTPAGVLGQTTDGRPSVGVYDENGGTPLWTSDGTTQPTSADDVLQGAKPSLNNVALKVGNFLVDMLNAGFPQQVKR